MQSKEDPPDLFKEQNASLLNLRSYESDYESIPLRARAPVTSSMKIMNKGTSPAMKNIYHRGTNVERQYDDLYNQNQYYHVTSIVDIHSKQQQQQQQHHQTYQSKSNSGSGNTNNNNSNNNNNNNNNSSATWSSVTSAHEPAIQKPLLYQSPQFQHEFPSLDGSNAQAQSKGNRGSTNANQSDAHNINNNQNANANAADTQLDRAQNDGHSDSSGSHQQHSGNCNSSTGGQAHQQVVPPQFRALMPTFMRNTITGFDSLQCEPEQQLQHQQYQHQQQMGGNRDNRRNYGRPDGRDQQYQSYNRNSRDRNDERQYRRGGPPRSNRHDQNQYDDYEPGYQSKFLLLRALIFGRFFSNTWFFI